MRIYHWLLIIAAVVFLGIGVSGFWGKNAGLREEKEKLKAELDSLLSEKTKIEEEIQYLSFPENLLKQIKARFNYKERYENMFIVIPE